MFGGPGGGKTHLAAALGLAARTNDLPSDSQFCDER
jgi:DNA replication protein DnaC